MPLGIQSYHRVNTGDTAELRRYIFDEDEIAVDPDIIVQVKFTIQKPDNSQSTHNGIVEDDGAGFYRWTDTADLGEYKYIASFTLDTGQVRSTRGTFEVIDPFNPPTPSPIEALSDAVWLKIEDCFDSEEGGPWLRDETLRYFNRNKIPEFVPDGMLLINVTPPMTNLLIDTFTTPLADGSPDPDMPILVLATFLEVVRHLMRSYVEQPASANANVVYEDRRDYLQRWQLIYQMEMDYFLRVLAMWKRQYIGLGHSQILVTAKAGRLLPAPLRSRNIGRGYY